MAQTDRPEALLDAAQLIFQPADDVEAVVNNFLQRWGGWTLDVFARVLQQTDETDPDELAQDDKLFALLALGFLAYPEASALLFPFIHSPKRTERWVSTLSLGLLRESAVCPLLQQMLLEDLLNPRAFDHDSFYDSNWYMVLRCQIALVLGEWGNPLAISPLCEAIRQCWAFETNPNMYFGKPANSFEDYDSWIIDYDRLIDRL
ncbi:hypothetical protein [Ktedonobacter racemifer]|uniref:PBS lyase HEAT domain protein repeat-containing protein n=1 Tax=Ktedonobacter racemifer DSM 44963 TaxID=485913 RepID=D6U725_KTERA|nr:hypothetical protein [Ktedonobacter racemifer]EFH79686.1 hypothetical protein Krac_0172 [Ktedonobacter racemifer DSM 44963]